MIDFYRMCNWVYLPGKDLLEEEIKIRWIHHVDTLLKYYSIKLHFHHSRVTYLYSLDTV